MKNKMMYKITIKRKDSSKLIKESNNRNVIIGYANTVKRYGDKIVSIEERNNYGKWNPSKSLLNLIFAGATIGIGFRLLGDLAGNLKS